MFLSFSHHHRLGVMLLLLRRPLLVVEDGTTAVAVVDGTAHWSRKRKQVVVAVDGTPLLLKRNPVVAALAVGIPLTLLQALQQLLVAGILWEDLQPPVSFPAIHKVFAEWGTVTYILFFLAKGFTKSVWRVVWTRNLTYWVGRYNLQTFVCLSLPSSPSRNSRNCYEKTLMEFDIFLHFLFWIFPAFACFENCCLYFSIYLSKNCGPFFWKV